MNSLAHVYAAIGAGNPLPLALSEDRPTILLRIVPRTDIYATSDERPTLAAPDNWSAVLRSLRGVVIRSITLALGGAR